MAVLFVPPPRLVLRWMIVSVSPILLEGPRPNQSRIVGVSKRLLRAYMNVSIAAYLAERAMAQGGGDDVILGRMMADVRTIVINPRKPEEIRHSTAVWPALLSGVGYCDQLNAIVCRMGAHHFPKAELVALYLPEGRMSPHTVGRVWSKERGEWLYFDAFYARPVIYTRDASGQPHFLSTYAGDFMPSREVMDPAIYALQGWKLSDFPGTFGMYLVRRALGGDSDAAETLAATSVEPVATGTAMLGEKPTGMVTLEMTTPTGDRAPVYQPEVFRRVVRAYAAARVSHLLGHRDRNAYHAVARQSRAAQRDDRAAEITSAAARFATLPN